MNYYERRFNLTVLEIGYDKINHNSHDIADVIIRS